MQVPGSTQAGQTAGCIKDKLLIYFKHKAKAGMTIHDTAEAQQCAAKARDTGIGSLQWCARVNLH